MSKDGQKPDKGVDGTPHPRPPVPLRPLPRPPAPPPKPTGKQIDNQKGEVMTYRRTVYFEHGYNKRDEGKGVHGMGIRFLLSGPHGAVQFAFNTGWVPGEKMSPRVADLYPTGSDVGHHWLTSTYEGERLHGSCSFLGGQDCYYDGSGLWADRLLPQFIERGEPAVWRELIRYYRELVQSAAELAVA